MSTRGLEWANQEATSKSAASAHWVKASAAKIEELRQRDLKPHTKGVAKVVPLAAASGLTSGDAQTMAAR
jgi:hypothetical protein